MTQSKPRGIRNRNPLNIEHKDFNPWMGLADPPSDGRYCVFVHPIYGFRAALRTMESYRRRGVVTLEAVIQRWAPHDDGNPTRQYVGFVRTYAGVGVSEVVLKSRKLKEILAGMCVFENGSQPYDRLVFDAAVELWRNEVR